MTRLAPRFALQFTIALATLAVACGGSGSSGGPGAGGSGFGGSGTGGSGTGGSGVGGSSGVGASGGSSGSAGAAGNAGTGGAAGAGGTGAGPGCAVAVKAGHAHTCARRSDGTLWCWGYDNEGQVGDGAVQNSVSSPNQVGALGANVAQFALGVWHSCAVKIDGTAWCWGMNSHGLLGNGTTATPQLAPVQVVSTGVGFVEVATGQVHTCARSADGSAWCWGAGSVGELGDGKGTSSSTPVQVASLGATVAEIGAGNMSSCARKTDGTLWCWGSGTFGKLGNGSNTKALSPVWVEAGPGAVVRIAIAENYGCALDTAGAMWCWGQNNKGQLGNGTTTDASTPVQVAALGANVVEIGTAGDHACARKADGTMWCWGNNSAHQLGVTTPSYTQTTPVQVQSVGTDVVEMALGGGHTCVRKKDASIWCWGSNGSGQLGAGTTDGYDDPVQAAVPCP